MSFSRPRALFIGPEAACNRSWVRRCTQNDCCRPILLIRGKLFFLLALVHPWQLSHEGCLAHAHFKIDTCWDRVLLTWDALLQRLGYTYPLTVFVRDSNPQWDERANRRIISKGKNQQKNCGMVYKSKQLQDLLASESNQHKCTIVWRVCEGCLWVWFVPLDPCG